MDTKDEVEFTEPFQLENIYLQKSHSCPHRLIWPNFACQAELLFNTYLAAAIHTILSICTVQIIKKGSMVTTPSRKMGICVWWPIIFCVCMYLPKIKTLSGKLLEL